VMLVDGLVTADIVDGVNMSHARQISYREK
jgi:hypothetical protein